MQTPLASPEFPFSMATLSFYPWVLSYSFISFASHFSANAYAFLAPPASLNVICVALLCVRCFTCFTHCLLCFACRACFGQRQLGPTMHLHIITACFNLLLLLCFGVARFAVFAFDHAFAHNHGECDGHLLLKLFTPHCNLILLKLQLLILRRRWMGTSAVFAVVHCVAVCAQNAEAWKLS